MASLSIICRVILALCSCGAALASSEESCEPEEMIKENLMKLAFANNYFAFNLYRKLSSESYDNILISPFSISTAFGVLFRGTRGETAEELRHVLGYRKADLLDEQVHAAYSYFLDAMLKDEAEANDSALNSANAILVDKRLKVFPDYVKDVGDWYKASVLETDFQDSDSQVVADINKWVEERTHGKIKSLLHTISPMEVMIILNAIYFKGTWRIQFPPQKTTMQLFYNNGLKSEAKLVPMMQLTARFYYVFAGGYHILNLPYTENNSSMMLWLPSEKRQIGNLEQGLTLNKMVNLKRMMTDTKVVLSLPRFKLEYTQELSRELQELGAGKIFQVGNAEFSGLTPRKDVFVSQVIHKTTIEVNEEGTEASSLTGIATARMWPNMDSTQVYRVDRPFILTIQKNDTVIFVARVNAL